MKMFRDFVVSTVIASVLIAAGWYFGSYSQGSVDRVPTSDLAQDMLPRVGLSASESEADFLADFSRAKLLASHARYDSLIEVHQVPVIARNNAQMALENQVLPPCTLDHFLLVVERGKHQQLRDAKVLGTHRTHAWASHDVTAAIVEVRGTGEVYIVSAKRTHEELEFRIHSLNFDSPNPVTWGTLMANPSMAFPQSLSFISSTQTTIPNLSSHNGEAADFTATAVSTNADLSLEISVPGASVNRGHVLCRQSYSLGKNKWSSAALSPFHCRGKFDPKLPWQFEREHTKARSVLPLQEQAERASVARPGYLALVEQSYRYLPINNGLHRAFWVVGCSSDGDLKGAIPFGVIYPACSRFQQGGGFCDFSAALVYQPELDHCFVVTNGYSKSGCSLFVFRCSLVKPLVGQDLELTANPENWPAQMEQVAELPMHLLDHQVSIESARLSSNSSNEDASLVVTMKPWSNWQDAWQETCRYNFRDRKWTTTKQKVDITAGVQQ